MAFYRKKEKMEKQISRRNFLKTSTVALGAVALSNVTSAGSAFAAGQGKSQVYFTKDISVNGLLNVYSKINQGMTGKIGIKLHTGEPNGPNILPRDMVKALQRHIPNSNIKEGVGHFCGFESLHSDSRILI